MAVPFRLKSALPADDLRVHACAAREGLSELGETTLTLLSERKDILASDLLGKPATLTIAQRDDAPRHLSGYVTRFALSGFEGRHSVYQMTLRPWLWLLTRTADCRIFQDQTVPDIVKAVFDDHPVAKHEFPCSAPTGPGLTASVPRDRLQLRRPAAGERGHLLVLQPRRQRPHADPDRLRLRA
ncbi:hypothetical protein Ddc_21102 [Ditylenchus destructor]|nr:hypothetical protein Ddc_21102 [Ditylenchus destructor]